MARTAGRATSTSAFGVGGRENHDASAFYARFHPKELSADEDVAAPFELAQPLVCGDARSMDLPDNSVALVVTSPPYFAGKAYEEAMGQGAIPASYAEYLEMLCAVFGECRRVLEPGGRIAVNVANLGRKPYRSLSGDVARILDEDLGLLLRGEIVWKKADGAAGSCAWGSYRSPTNPVLRDTTERVVVASKGRFDRAVGVAGRQRLGLPHRATVTTDEFLEATLDVWEIRPESARRVQHPAPFPVELPQRLIELYTFEGDLVLDPFLGSGTTAVAAVRTGRRYAGYDTDEGYVARARDRVAAEVQGAPAAPATGTVGAGDAAGDAGVGEGEAPVPERRRVRTRGGGQAASSWAASLVEAAGFAVVGLDRRVPGLGLEVSIAAEDAAGEPWWFDVTGAFTTVQAGLARADTLWRCLGRASVLRARGLWPLVLLTSDLPPRRSAGDRALRAVGPTGVFDVVALDDDDDDGADAHAGAPAGAHAGPGHERLSAYAAGGGRRRPLPGFWTDADLAAAPPPA